MPHYHRFFVPQEASDSGIVELPQDEAHHASRVLRLRQGDAVGLFDGHGRTWEGSIHEIDRRRAVVNCRPAVHHPAPDRRLTLVQAWLNHDKANATIVQRAAELGVVRVRFFKAAHSERPPRVDDKLRRLAAESCKQCGRAWMPELETCVDIQAGLAGLTGAKLLAALEGPFASLGYALSNHDEAAWLVGPEGDFSPGEIDFARSAGAVLISLGEATYRSELAATLCIALVQYEWGELG